MHSSFLCVFIAFLALNFPNADSYKILLIAPGLSNSQLIFNYRIADLLGSRGHDVTVYLAQYHSSKVIDMNRKPKHAKLIPFQASTKFDEIKKVMDEKLYEDMNPVAAIPIFMNWINEFKDSCERQIQNKELLAKLKSENFDLAIGHMYDLCPFGIIKALNISSYIWMSSGILLDYMSWYTGVPSPASYVPNALSSFGDRMTLAERFKNLVGVSIFHFMYRYLSMNPYRELFRKYYGPDFPDVLELAAKSPLIFVNSEELIDFPRPILHKVIYIGGIDTSKPAPLTQEWQDIMDNSKKGVILFSFGSVADPSKMPAPWKAAFLEAFTHFPDYTIVWKYDGDLPGAAKVKNLKLTKWAPQKDMLGHPKLKAFITHCGFNSLMEAVTNGVPMLAFPMFGDQLGNVKRAERHGVAVGLKKSELSVDAIVKGLNEVLNNANYSLNAKKLSSMIKKKPVKPEQLAVGWVEFLAEHKELPNLQPVSAEIGLLEYFLVDVAVILLLGVIVILFITYIIAQCLFYRFCKKGGSRRKRSKSKRE